MSHIKKLNLFPLQALLVALCLFGGPGMFAANETSPATTEIQGRIQDKMPQNSALPLKIGVTFVLNNIISLDEKSGLFQADIDLTLTWENTDQAFDPKIIGQTLLSLNEKETKEKLQTIWYPQITISNLEKIISDVPSMTMTNEGLINYVQRIKAEFKMDPDLRTFPFDTQQLVFYLDAEKNTTSEIKFYQDQNQANKSGIRQGVKLEGWTLDNVEYENSIVRNANGSFFSRFEIKIIMTRISQVHIFAFAPLILIALAPTLMTLYLYDTFLSQRLTAWGASLLTLIATNFALHQQYPALGPDSILPVIISTMMVYQFFMIILALTFVNPSFVDRLKNPFLAPAVVLFLQWSVPLLVFLIIFTRILTISSPI